MQHPFKTAFVALLGLPNVGKSSLLNRLLGAKVSIVSPKPQTTQKRLRGILNLPHGQLVLLDTPGLCSEQTLLHRAMRKTTRASASEADVHVLICDASAAEPLDPHLVTSVNWDKPTFVVLNKIDKLAHKNHLLPKMQAIAQRVGARGILPMSAKTGENTELLATQVLAAAPPGPPLFAQDLHTDASEREICAELIREQLLVVTHQEVPHTCAVTIESFADGRAEAAGRCRLVARIMVSRDSQKGIVIGKGGQTLKVIGQHSRHQMARLLGAPTDLQLTVHVDPQWTTQHAALRRYGLIA